MKQILKDYKDIYINYPESSILNKAQKKEKNECIMKWNNTEYEEMPEFDEVIEFMNSNESIPIIQPFVKKVLVKIVYKDICNYKFESLKELFEMTPSELVNTIDDYIYILEEESNFKYTSMELEYLVLEHYPDNITVLNHKYSKLFRNIDFSVHEVPSGVLWGINGAELNDIVYLRKDLEMFKELSIKLNYYDKDKEFIKYCETMYCAYEDYLKNLDMYYGFEEYLVRNNIIDQDSNLNE